MPLLHLVKVDEVATKVNRFHHVDLLFAGSVAPQVLLDHGRQLGLSLFADLVHNPHPFRVFPILLDHSSSVDLTLNLVPPIPFGDVLFPASLNSFDRADDFGVLHILSHILFHLVKSEAVDVMIGKLDIWDLLSDIFEEFLLFY
jgi:hypothetical protein